MNVPGQTPSCDGWPRLARLLFGFAFALALIISPAHAQDEQSDPIVEDVPGQEVEDAPAARVQPALDLDALSLVTGKDVFEEKVTAEPIWLIAAGTGRKLVQIPVFVTPIDQDADLNARVVRVRSGRFIAWRFSEPPERAPEGSVAAERIASAHAADAPGVSRTITIRPNGVMAWKLDRAIPGAVVDDAALAGKKDYALKLRSDYLKTLEPKKAPFVRKTETEDAKTYRDRTRLEEEKYRAEQLDYRDLLRRVRELPTEFEASLPARVWCIFELPATANALVIEGLSERPWDISFANLQKIRDASEPVRTEVANDETRIMADDRDRLQSLSALVRVDHHPLTHRAVAFAVAKSGAINHMRPDDSLHQLALSIIQGSDSDARKAIVRSLLPIGHTAAGRSLLAAAASSMTPQMKFERFKGLIKSNLTDAAQAKDMLSNLNEMFGDSEGPSVQELFGQLLVEAKDAAALQAAVTQGLSIARITGQRRDDLIAAIVTAAPSDPFAERLLDAVLLGNDSEAIITQTLSVMAKIPASDADKPAKLIAIRTSTDTIMTVLQHTSPQVRAIAWQALPRYAFMPARDDAGTLDELFQTLHEIAMRHSPTPLGYVDFLTAQADADRAGKYLVRVVATGSDDASAKAAQALYGSGRKLERAVFDLSYSEREKFGQRMYSHLTGRLPIVTLLLRQAVQDNPLTSWFAKAVSEGKLPADAEWGPAFAQSARWEDFILDRMLSSDEQLSTGMLAALVAAAGGNDTATLELVPQMVTQPSANIDVLRAKWLKHKRTMYMSRIQKSVGPHRMIFELWEDGAKTGTPPTQVINIGVVNLNTDGKSVSIGYEAIAMSIPESQLSIRIERPDRLKSLSSQLENINLQQVAGGLIDLMPQPDGRWIGEFTIPGAQSGRVILEPSTGGE